MVSLAGAAALLAASWLAMAAPAPAPGLARPELRQAAWLCLVLSCSGSVLLGAAAALNSPRLLLTAGAVAVATVLLGTHSIAPSVLVVLLDALAQLSTAAVRAFLWLSMAMPTLYGVLVGVSAVYSALSHEVDCVAQAPTR
eukprot:COSAG05_NODE_8792_length_671_cov_0.729021_1_plen_141_part_00